MHEACGRATALLGLKKKCCCMEKRGASLEAHLTGPPIFFSFASTFIKTKMAVRVRKAAGRDTERKVCPDAPRYRGTWGLL